MNVYSFIICALKTILKQIQLTKWQLIVMAFVKYLVESRPQKVVLLFSTWAVLLPNYQDW